MMTLTRSNLLVLNHGDLLKSYRIVSADPSSKEGTPAKPLGEGGSGVVFRADQVLHKNIRIPRAIKFFVYSDKIAALTAHRGSGPVSASQYFEELVNIATVRHENLIKVIDVGMYAPQLTPSMEIPYIVTDYVQGPTLEEALKDDTFVQYLVDNPDCVLRLLLAICHGVGHLHAKRLFHCDIAPKNIFLEGETSELTAVLGDLGVGKRLTPTTDALDRSIFVAGTRDYSPPEVCQVLTSRIPESQFAKLQPRWDLYGLACTGLRMLAVLGPTAETPFPWHGALESLLVAVKRGEGPQHIRALEDKIEWLRPVHRTLAAVPELTDSFPGRRSRLIPVQTTVTSRRIRKLFHHPAVLRLKRVPQLMMGPAVFAGATHTRYEHSMGAFENMRRFLSALLDNQEFLQHFNASRIDTALVSAALCNLADYPFAHVVRAMGDCQNKLFPDFEPEKLLRRLFHDKPADDHVPLEEEVRTHFPAVELDTLIGLLAGDNSVLRDPGLRFIRAALDGSLGEL